MSHGKTAAVESSALREAAPVIARSTCDEAIQSEPGALDCFASSGGAEPVIGRAFARPGGADPLARNDGDATLMGRTYARNPLPRR
jgi:hypothetical protein